MIAETALALGVVDFALSAYLIRRGPRVEQHHSTHTYLIPPANPADAVICQTCQRHVHRYEAIDGAVKCANCIAEGK